MQFHSTWEAVFNASLIGDYFELDPLPGFDSRTDEFSVANAWYLAEISRLSYRSCHSDETWQTCQPPVDRLLERGGLRLVAMRRLDDPPLDYLLATFDGEPDVSVLAFHGDCDLETWLTSFEVVPTEVPGGGQVHSGYWEAVEAHADELRHDLAAAGGTLYFTGHSGGGAFAILTAAVHPPKAVYAFGAPKVGDPAFARRLDGIDVFSVINADDIIAAFPPSGTGKPLGMVGTRCELGEDGSVDFSHRPSDLGADAGRLWSEVLSALRRGPSETAPKGSADHGLTNYVARLERLVRNE